MPRFVVCVADGHASPTRSPTAKALNTVFVTLIFAVAVYMLVRSLGLM